MPKEKYEAKQAIKDEKKGDAGDKYSVEALRANMSTGGGEPIAKGKKMTNEKRVLQPRDPDTGHFTYNADAQYGLKYKQRAKGAVPVGARSWVLNDGIKKGDKVNINDKVWIAIADMDKDAVIDYFKKFDEESQEYYSFKEGEEPSGSGFEKNEGKAETFSSKFVRKRGMPSKQEKEGIAEGKRVVGNVDLSVLGNTTQKEMAKKFNDIAQGIDIKSISTIGVAPALSGAKLAENELKNKLADEKKGAGAVAGAAGTPAVAGAGAGTPVSSSPVNEKKEEPKEEPKQQEAKSNYAPTKSDIVKNPKAEYDAHKQYWDEKAKVYNEKNGTTHSGAWLVQALAKKYGSK